MSQAVDNQVYVATASPALGDRDSYVACRHSTDMNAWVTVLAKAGPEEVMVHSDTDLKKEARICQKIPFLAISDQTSTK